MADGDRVLVITGASGGIGAACARRALESGWRVALAARREPELGGGGDRALAVSCDVASWEDQQELVRRTLERFGRIDAVLANAGSNVRMGLLESSPDEWREMVLTNVLGTALTIRATLPHLLERGRGHYVLTGSLAARMAVPGSLYGATKAAVGNLADVLRAELHQMHDAPGIRVTLLEPGAVATAMNPADRLPFEPLAPGDIAHAVLEALERPAHVDITNIVLRPTDQPL